MLKNPWPSYWLPPRTGTFNHIQQPFCQFSNRYNMICVQKRYMCDSCYVKQQYISTSDTKIMCRVDPRRRGEFVHVCDRCGKEISVSGNMLFASVSNVKGGMVIPDAELCLSCGAELAEWLKGNDFFLADDFLKENRINSAADLLWGKDEEDEEEGEEE